MAGRRIKAGIGTGAGIVLLASGLAIGSTPAGAAVIPLTVDPTPDLPIADGATIESTGTVAGTSDTVAGLTATVAVTHDWLGDVKVTLTHVDSGTSVVLLDRPGTVDGVNGDQSNLQAAFPITFAAGTHPAAETMGSGPGMGHNFVVCGDGGSPCTYQPHESLAPFDGLPAASDWRLTVTDQSSHNGGTLAWWSLSLTTEVVAEPSNTPPVAHDDGYATDEDTPLVVGAPGVLTNDSDVDGDPLTTTVASDPVHGTLALDPDGGFTYTPDADYAGADVFVYELSDGTSTDQATATITVGAVNDAPALADSSWVTDEDTPLVVEDAEVQALTSDLDGDPLTFEVIGQPAHGGVTMAPSGGFTYTPDADHHGPDTFTVVANDGAQPADLGGLRLAAVSSAATFTVRVQPVNDAPRSQHDTAFTTEPDPVEVLVLDNDSDPDGDDLVVQSWSDPDDGEVACLAAVCTYQPDAGFAGTDSFQYTVTDGSGGMDTATVEVTVTAGTTPTSEPEDPTTAPSPPTSAPADPITGDEEPGGAVAGAGAVAGGSPTPLRAQPLPRTGQSSLSMVLMGLGLTLIGFGGRLAGQRSE